MHSVAMPERELTRRHGMSFERYLNDVDEPLAEQVVTETCVPVQPA